MGVTLGLFGAARFELGIMLTIATAFVECAIGAYLFWCLRALMNAPPGTRGWLTGVSGRHQPCARGSRRIHRSERRR
jgi:hypothetical protein